MTKDDAIYDSDGKTMSHQGVTSNKNNTRYTGPVDLDHIMEEDNNSPNL